MSSKALLLKHAPDAKLRARILRTREDIACPIIHAETGGYIGHKPPAKGDGPPDLDALLADGYRVVEAGSQ
jgi:hypothetical protein